MDSSNLKEVIDALEASYANVGVDLYSGAKRLKAWIESQLPLLEATQSRESLETYLRDGSTIDEAWMMQAVAFFAVAPHLLESALKMHIRQVADDIPAPLGRPTVLSPELSVAIVQTVSQLSLAGVSLGNAQSQAALKHNVSKRTVQNAWRKRGALHSQPFRSMDDLWKFVSPKHAQNSAKEAFRS